MGPNGDVINAHDLLSCSIEGFEFTNFNKCTGLRLRLKRFLGVDDLSSSEFHFNSVCFRQSGSCFKDLFSLKCNFIFSIKT